MEIDDLIEEIWPVEVIFAERKHDFMAYPDTTYRKLDGEDVCWLNTPKGKVYIVKVYNHV
jgi:hypothetical protein